MLVCMYVICMYNVCMTMYVYVYSTGIIGLKYLSIPYVCYYWGLTSQQQPGSYQGDMTIRLCIRLCEDRLLLLPNEPV